MKELTIESVKVEEYERLVKSGTVYDFDEGAFIIWGYDAKHQWYIIVEDSTQAFISTEIEEPINKITEAIDIFTGMEDLESITPAWLPKEIIKNRIDCAAGRNTFAICSDAELSEQYDLNLDTVEKYDKPSTVNLNKKNRLPPTVQSREEA